MRRGNNLVLYGMTRLPSAAKKMEQSLRKLAPVAQSPVAQSEAIAPRTANAPRDEIAYHAFPGGAQVLVEGYRLHGYCQASVNPLDLSPFDLSLVAELDPKAYGLAFDESVSYLIHLGDATHTLRLSKLLSRLQTIYCGSVSLESAHIRSADQRRWLYAQMEARSESSKSDVQDSLRILARLTAAEAFEHFQRANYPRHKQFSLEGSESLVALLGTVVEKAAQHGVEDLVLGMPHRGRLNMMLNALDVPAKQLMSLFSANPERSLAASDLKDHAGFSRRMQTAHGAIRVLLAHNPSHLESVSPVVCGMARALQDRRVDGSSKKVMPVLIHGDASFSGQGIVTETLNLSQTRGYGAGGTLHLILNNQIGSTVSHPRDSRSTLYGADIARAVDAPIVHVNADDPDAVVFAAKLATDYRMKFGADIVVDHIGYRRHGHFGADDPTMTQPAMQRQIRGHRSVVDLYAEKLVSRGIARDGERERLKTASLTSMAEARSGEATTAPTRAPPDSDAPPTGEKAAVSTQVPIGQLQTILQRLATVPRGFVLHADIEKMLGDWRSIADGRDRLIDWRLAENLAYGSLLVNGFNIRLTGLDVGRGSFFHRHHVLHNQTADTDWQSLHIPLRNIAPAQGYFSIFESPLSEEAVMGFEYGYTLQCGRDLVVWEAQFGDFVNNAQVIIDQYIATGESKWGYESGLVVLLPHGYEGGGPEHSSAFLGRFLQLCGEGNMQVAMPSTAAQLYHLLRRQALMDKRKPLIVMTPKMWLHGHQPSHSRLSDLAQEKYHPMLGDRDEIDAAAVVRAIVTSGKVYYDLLNARARARLPNVPILRLEQLYPFPADALAEELSRFPLLQELVWAQEEAKNHGAWHFLRDQLEAALPSGATLIYAGRPPAASSAVCDAGAHAAEQREAVASALGIAQD
jgi:2-oxoglutarate dehydrogenase E1 component